MADVTQAFDRVEQRQVALKRLRVSEQDKHAEFVTQLFEREFQVLSELAHPRVVEAYDYGVVDGLPYYSMELLDGGDLHGLSPLGVDQVCRVFRDIASVLALLHSRRLVYRDLNPRNIRCTSGGAAKLIDFGAMTVMGVSRKIIGTPGYVAPEVVHKQSLDGRVDLYVLGCAMYFALARRAPYVVRGFSQLKSAWAAELVAPSQFAPEVPKALDELILDLLQLDPAFRPATAAEVMDRLSAIGNLPSDEGLQVSRAYLVAPPLIDPHNVLRKARGHLKSAHAGSGRTLLLDAASGGGRTRMLEAVVLEAKLAGTVVLAADTGDAHRGDYGVAESLAGQLIDGVPEALALAESKAALLGYVVRRVQSAFPAVELQRFSDPRDKRPAVQAALREWFIAVSESSPFVAAVDDVERVDEPSLALLALLAAAIEHCSVCLVLTMTHEASGQASPAVAVLRQRARVLPLYAFNREQTQMLLSATFGDSVQLPLLTGRLYEVSRGNPRDLMQLAQYVVDHRIVRYEGGGWVLPQRLVDYDLPQSAEDALLMVIDRLGERARELAMWFAISTKSGLRFGDCIMLVSDGQSRGLIRAFAELIAADVLLVSDGVYRLSRSVWKRLLWGRAAELELAALHGRMATTLQESPDAELVRIHHLRCAAQDPQALDLMVLFCTRSVVKTDTDVAAFQDLVESLPDDWYRLFAWAIAEAEASGRPRRDAHAIRSRLSGFIGMTPDSNTVHLEVLVSQLSHDVGLDIYEELADEVADPGERLRQTFERAQARYDGASEQERVFSPFEALRPLAQAVVVASVVAFARYDYHLLSILPSLRSLEPLSPAMGVVQLLLEGVRNRVQGRYRRTVAAYTEVLARLDRPDRSGLDETRAKYTRTALLAGLGMLDVVLGRDRALERAEALSGGALMSHGAESLRMLHHYYHSEPKLGDALRRELVLLKIQSSSMQFLDGMYLAPEAIGHCLVRDLPRLKEVLLEMKVYSKKRVGWQPVVLYISGECERLRGNLVAAEGLFLEALGLCEAGTHQIWPNLAGAYLATLVGLNRGHEAAGVAAEYRKAAEGAEQGRNVYFIQIPQVAALASCGQVEEARAEVDGLIEAMLENQVSGVLLGGAFEVSAQVAIVEGNRVFALSQISECAKHLRAEHNRSGHARCDRLRRELDHVTQSEMVSFELSVLQSETRSRILEVMGKCTDVEQRQRRALEVILFQSGATSGALFLNQPGGPVLVAMVNMASVTDGILTIARRHLEMLIASEAAAVDDETCTQTAVGGDRRYGDMTDRDNGFRVVLIGHREESEYMLTGIAVVVPQPQARFTLSPAVPEMLSRFLVRSGSSTLCSTTLNATRV